MAVMLCLLSAEEPSIPVQLYGGRCVQLLVVEAYQHLGNMVVHTGSPVPCIQSRVRAAAGAFERLSATLFRNVEVTTAEKRTLLESMLLRKLYFGAGLWTLCTKHERSFFSSSLHRDSEVCAAWASKRLRKLHSSTAF